MLWTFLKKFSVEMIWIFIILIAGFFLLSILQKKVGGPIGNVAGDIAGLASAH